MLENKLDRDRHKYCMTCLYWNQKISFKNKKRVAGVVIKVLCVPEVLSHHQLFVTPWTVASQAPHPWLPPDRMLEWDAILPLSRRSASREIKTHVYSIPGSSTFPVWAIRGSVWNLISAAWWSSVIKSHMGLTYCGERLNFSFFLNNLKDRKLGVKPRYVTEWEGNFKIFLWDNDEDTLNRLQSDWPFHHRPPDERLAHPAPSLRL